MKPAGERAQMKEEPVNNNVSTERIEMVKIKTMSHAPNKALILFDAF